jgi:hypothetical protein
MGFPSQLAGVRLFPIQAVESAWILTLVICSTIQLLRHAASGTVFAFYVTAYALGRFVFEFARGDADRPYWLGFSQAQWISAALASAIFLAGYRGALPFHLWQAFAQASLLSAMPVIAAIRQLATARRHVLLGPSHMQEIVAVLKQVLDHANAVPQETPVYSTSLGIQISGGILCQRGGAIAHYAISGRGTPLSPERARLLVRFILLVRHPFVRFYQCSQGALGVYILLVLTEECEW